MVFVLLRLKAVRSRADAHNHGQCRLPLTAPNALRRTRTRSAMLNATPLHTIRATPVNCLSFGKLSLQTLLLFLTFGSASSQGYSPVLCPSVVMVVSPRKHELDVLHVVSVEGLPFLTSNFVGLVELSCVLLTAPERMCWRCPGVLWQLAQRVVGRILVLGPRLLKTFDLCIVLVLPPLHRMQNDSF